METYDFDLRRDILTLLANGAPNLQRLILNLAITKNAPGVRRAAVAALVSAEGVLDPSVVAAVAPERLVRQPAPIASELTIIVGWRGSAAQVQAAAEALSASANPPKSLIGTHGKSRLAMNGLAEIYPLMAKELSAEPMTRPPLPPMFSPWPTR